MSKLDLYTLEEVFRHVLKTAERCEWNPRDAALALKDLARSRLSREEADILIESLVLSIGAKTH